MNREREFDRFESCGILCSSVLTFFSSITNMDILNQIVWVTFRFLSSLALQQWIETAELANNLQTQFLAGTL